MLTNNQKGRKRGKKEWNAGSEILLLFLEVLLQLGYE